MPFSINWVQLGTLVKGIGLSTKLQILKRFELTSFYYNQRATFLETSKEVKKSINRIFSQMSSLNFQVTEINRLNVIRLFLIKSFRGKAQALGKPSRGQRTWSNAWTAYLVNRDLRKFIAEVQKQLNKDKKEEKINYKLLKKKTLNKQQQSVVNKKVEKRAVWF